MHDGRQDMGFYRRMLEVRTGENRELDEYETRVSNKMNETKVCSGNTYQKGSERGDDHIPVTFLSVHFGGHYPALGTHARTHRGLFLLLPAWGANQEFHRS